MGGRPRAVKQEQGGPATGHPEGDGTRVARVICDVTTTDGQAFAGDPRAVLRRQLAAAAERGYAVRANAEVEFFLFRAGPDGARSRWPEGANTAPEHVCIYLPAAIARASFETARPHAAASSSGSSETRATWGLGMTRAWPRRRGAMSGCGAQGIPERVGGARGCGRG